MRVASRMRPERRSTQASAHLIDARRRTNWATAGVRGGIPSRSTVYTTLSSSSSASDINTAIANCPAGQVVALGTGTFALSAGLIFNGKSNVTLRGAGPSLTILDFAEGVSCAGLMCSIGVKSSTTSDTSAPTHTANWTAGYTKGATVVTLSNVTGLSVGQLLMLDQENESADTGDVWNNSTTATCYGGPAGGGRPTTPRREQLQVVRVEAINGTDVTISPGLHMPNWRSGQNPGAWWNADQVDGVGIEDLSIDNATAGDSGIIFMYAADCWVKNVRSMWGGRSHIWSWLTKNLTVRDSYCYEGNAHGSQSYGVELFMASDALIENNIFDKVTASIIVNGPASGSVIAYNYIYKSLYSSDDWLIPSHCNHATGTGMMLVEGNDGSGWMGDSVHGPGFFITLFRNRFVGSQPGLTETAQTIPVHIYAFWRFINVIGNVLGDNATHDFYECVPATNSTADGGASRYFPVYCLGWSMNGGYKDATTPNDTLVYATLMRWGNYDTYHDDVRWESSEVPSALSTYPNAVPFGTALPTSMYLTSRPAWFGAAAWPPIGPDVTGGNVSGLGGHVNKIPARLHFEACTQDGARLLTNFNGNSYYA